MGEVLFLTNMQRHATMMEKVRCSLAAELPVQGRVMDLRGNGADSAELQAIAARHACVIISWMGQNNVEKLTSWLQRNRIPYAFLPSDISMQPGFQGFTEEEVWRLRDYLIHGGLENFRLLWLWLAQRQTAQGAIPAEPQEMPWCGLVDLQSGAAYHDLMEFREKFLTPGLPVAGLLLSRDEWLWQDLSYHRAIQAKFREQGMAVLPFFSYRVSEPGRGIGGVGEALKNFCFINGQPAIDALIVTIKFSLTVGTGITARLFKELHVPILQAYTMTQAEADWQENSQGCSPWEVSSGIVLPEYDGVIHTVPVAGKDKNAADAAYRPIDERIGRLARRTAAWLNLKSKANAEKKLAIIFHNYPPANASIGNAAGLDSPASVLELLRRLKQAGYHTGELPEDSQCLMEEIIAAGTNDQHYLNEERAAVMQGHVPASRYQNWFADWPAKVRAQMSQAWGRPPGEVLVDQDRLLVPGVRYGNILVTVQPPRGFDSDPGKIYHSPDAPPPHQYLAFYNWLQYCLEADAVVHVGTHGSLEWLPGKSTGLSASCYPDIAIGDLPNLYPYLITIVGEGMQAKRRSGAVLIGHMSPPLVKSGVYEELAELEKMLDEYQDSMKLQPAQLNRLEENIRLKAAEANLSTEVPEIPAEDFAGYYARLHAYLATLSNLDVRTGLHILGQAPKRESIKDYVAALTKADSPEAPSLPRTVAQLCGYHYEQLLPGKQPLTAAQELQRSKEFRLIGERVEQFLTILDEAHYDWDKANPVIRQLSWVNAAACELQQQLLGLGSWICEQLVRRLQQTEQEMTHLLAGLAGQYLEPGPAGAATSGMPDILPTGRNFYGVDPRTIPSQSGWSMGQELADQVIARFIAEEGRYPESIGMVFWGGANLRSRGQCIAEFLALLGVRPVWQRGSGRVSGVEVIPLAELKRPRIDVTARISGLFRDIVPEAADIMDKAVQLVAGLDEPVDSNYVRKHIVAEQVQLTAAGVEAGQARQQAGMRIFGSPPGSYGAGVGALLEAKNWERVEDLAQVYVRWGAHAYGGGNQGEYHPEAFSRRLATLDITIKNEDNREVNLLSSDDFNAYHGGMVAAVRGLSGRKPRSYVGDSSDRANVAVRSLTEEFKQLYRSQVVNPKFIDSMKKHGYKGAADLAAIAAHCYDWDATSETMEDWMYEGLAQKYALDQDMQNWLKAVNPWALSRIAEKLLEAAQRNMWQPHPETLTALTGLFLEIEGDLEERSEK